MKRNYKYSDSSLKKINSVIPLLQLICHDAIKISNERKLHCPDFGISYGLRTCVEQFELFKLGRTEIKGEWVITDISKVVTHCDGYVDKSPHQSGKAIDFFAVSTGGNIDYSPASMALVATCFFEAASKNNGNAFWGGSFINFNDSGHFELR